MHYSKLSNIVKNCIERMINMDQFIMAGLIGAIVVIVSYTTIQVIDITDKYLDNRKYMVALRLTPGRLYERPNNPPPPPVRLSASEELKQYTANETLKRHAANLKRLQGEHKMRCNSTLQEKAIEAAQKVLYGVDKFDYLAADGDLNGMFVVWFCKTLQNWKAIVAGRDFDEFIEVTHNGDKNETYVDIYRKVTNACVTYDCNGHTYIKSIKEL